MAYQETQTTRQQTQAQSVGASKVLRNTYGLLAMTLLFSAITAGAAMSMGVERMNIFVFFIGAYGLMF
ncbi:FtsH protease modulator YccA, partial [Enterococcus hirae]